MTELEQRAVEVGLLGAILKSSKNFAFISENVRPDYFSWDCYRELYGVMLELADKGLGIDTITVGDAMESKNRLSGFTLHDDNVINGRLALSVLRDEGMPENSISYAQILKNYAANKEILETVTKGAGWVAGGRNPSETIADLTKSLLGIDTVDSKTSTATISFSLAVEKAFDMYESASRGNSTFIQTGLRLLDRAIVGLSAPDLVIVAARPGVGKTAFLLRLFTTSCRNTPKISLFLASRWVLSRSRCAFCLWSPA
jgi:replicative DNA helicase